MKIQLRYLLLLPYLITSELSAQTFGNEWINPQQTYLKIPIAQRGMYQISWAELQKAGVPTTTDPRNVQVFHRGKEQAITINGEADGQWNIGDVLTFYGIRNDGSQDSLFYFNNKQTLNPYFNLYSDSTAYFLTWRLDAGRGKRMVSVGQSVENQSGITEKYHIEETIRIWTDDYAPGNSLPLGVFDWDNVFYTHYDDAEGWSSGEWNGSQTILLELNAPFLVRSGPKPSVVYQLVGRSPKRHQVDFSGNQRQFLTQNFNNYDPAIAQFSTDFSDFNIDNALIINLKSQNKDDAYSAVYQRFRFPQEWRMDGLSEKQFIVPAKQGAFTVEIKNVPTNAQLYDITDSHTIRLLQADRVGASLTISTTGNGQEQVWWLSGQSRSVANIRKVSMRATAPVKANYLIVSHPKLMKPTTGTTDAVRSYAAYRASVAGGGYDTLCVTTEEACNVFNYGEFSPAGIRNMAQFFVARGKAQFMFLMGTAWWSHRVRFDANRYDKDMVPQVGWPGADLPLVMGLNGEPTYQISLPLGRLNTDQPQTVIDYLNKVKEHENPNNTGLWRKNILHLSGGRSSFEITTFKNYLSDFQKITEQAKLLGTRFQALTKKTDEPVEPVNIQEQLNSGLGMITMFGHSSGETADTDIGLASNSLLGYRNKGKYPLIVANGCSANNFYLGNATFSSDWVNTPDKGAILFLAHTGTGYVVALQSFSTLLYQHLLTDSTQFFKPFGQVQQAFVKKFVAQNPNYLGYSHAQQMILQGDPAVAVFPMAKPDLTIDKGGVLLQGYRNEAITSVSDSFRIGLIISNVGRNFNQKHTASIKRTLNDGTVINLRKTALTAVAYQDTIWVNIPNKNLNGAGLNTFEVVADADNMVAELNENNNTQSLQVNITNNGLELPLLPQPDRTSPVLEVVFDGRSLQQNDYVSANPLINIRLRDEHPYLIRKDTLGIDLWLQRSCDACKLQRIPWKSPEVSWKTTPNNEFLAEYRPKNLPDGDKYRLQVQGRDLSGNAAGLQPYSINFKVKAESLIEAFTVMPNPSTTYAKFSIKLSGKVPPESYKLLVLNNLGQVLRTFDQTEAPLIIGTNDILWHTQHLPNGLYLYQLQLWGEKRTGKLLIWK